MDDLRSIAAMTGSGAYAAIADSVRIPQIAIHLFAVREPLLSSAEEAFMDRRMARAQTLVRSGGVAAAIDAYRSAQSPHVLIVESDGDRAELLDQLGALADVCAARTKVVIVGHVNDVALYRELMDCGVSEYVIAPLEPMAIIGLTARLFKNAASQKFGRTVAFVGATGGAGSSTMAHNVSAALARKQQAHVILADMDLPFGSVGLGFNLGEVPGVRQALEGAGRLDDVLLERLLLKCGPHLSLLPSPASMNDECDLGEDAFGHLIDVAQSMAPFVALDVPHVWSAWSRKTLLSADDIVITAPPTLTGLRNAANLAAVVKAARPNDAPPNVVLNQVGMRHRAEIAPEKFASALKLKLAACIKFDPAPFSAAANAGRMIVDMAPRSAAAMAFEEIADAICGQPRSARPSSKWLAFRRLRMGQKR